MPSCYVVNTPILRPVILSVNFLSPSQEIRVLTSLLQSREVILHKRPTPNTGCPRRNGQNFGRVFLMLKYTDITQNTYIQS